MMIVGCEAAIITITVGPRPARRRGLLSVVHTGGGGGLGGLGWRRAPATERLASHVAQQSCGGRP